MKFTSNLNEGEKLFAQGNYHEAKKVFKEIVRLDNKNFISYWYLGHCYFKLHKYHKSLNQINKSIELKGKDVLNLNFLGKIYIEKNHYDIAIGLFNEALFYDKKNQTTLKNLASAYLNTGDLEKSKKIYSQLCEIDSHNLAYSYALSKVDDNYINKIKIKDIAQTELNKIYLNLISAKLNQSKKNYELEFNHLNSAHSLYLKSKDNVLNQQYNFYTKDLKNFINKIKNIKYLSKNNQSPVFILGLPRSGTTLVEKIIYSGNDKIQSMGEADCFDKTFFSNQYISNYKLNEHDFKFEIDDLKLLETNLLTQYYDQGLLKNIKIFTDKSISNIFYIHLIKKIFPNSRFIYCNRNKVLNLVGILRSFLPEIYWSHSIDKSSLMQKYYNEYLRECEKFYKKDLFIINLEELTSDPVKISQKLYNFLGFKWSAEVLEVKKNFVVKTSSNIQVREKIKKHNLEDVQIYEKVLLELGYNF